MNQARNHTLSDCFDGQTSAVVVDVESMMVTHGFEMLVHRDPRGSFVQGVCVKAVCANAVCGGPGLNSTTHDQGACPVTHQRRVFGPLARLLPRRLPNIARQPHLRSHGVSGMKPATQTRRIRGGSGAAVTTSGLRRASDASAAIAVLGSMARPG